MNAQESAAKFKQADTLFKQGDFGGAFRLLAELNEAHPNTNNILYPMALCLEKTQQWDQGEALCDRLIGELNDPRAAAIKARIQNARPSATSATAPSGNTPDDNLFAAAPKGVPDPRRSRGPNLGRYALIAAAALIVVAVVAAAVMIIKKDEIDDAPETVESVAAQLIDPLLAADSCQMRVDMRFEVKQEDEDVTIRISGALDMLEENGRNYFRLEGSASTSAGMMGMPMKMSTLMVANDEGMYMQMEMMGQFSVMRMPINAEIASETPFSLEALKTMIPELLKTANAKLLPESTLNGRPAYALQLTPEPDMIASMPLPGMAEQMGDVENVNISFTKGDLYGVRIVMSDAAGAPLATLAFKDIMLNKALSVNLFNYTLPPGATITDVENMEEMMNMMAPAPDVAL